MITLSTHSPSNRFRRLAWQARLNRYSKALAEAAGLQTRSGNTPTSSDAADHCAPSTGGAAFWITEALGGIGLCLALAAILSLAEALPDAIVGAFEVPAPEPECRKQFTPDTRFVRHCNFHDGRDWIETTKDTK